MPTILAQSFHFVGYVYNDLRKNSQMDINLGGNTLQVQNGQKDSLIYDAF